MAEAILNIKHWGSNLGVRLPDAVARAAHLSAEQRVRITVEDGRVIITPFETSLLSLLSLADRLARFEPEHHGGEAMPVDGALGAETWPE